MSFSMQKLRSLLPRAQHGSLSADQRHSVTLEPEVGFQISIETVLQQNEDSSGQLNGVDNTVHGNAKAILNVHLLAARHLPALFGFKLVLGYVIKVKLFPGTKRLDSSIQTNSWPKFNETFKFPLSPEYKSSLKHSSINGGGGSTKYVSEFTPEELFGGQFVVFTVYALLELPPANFNRFNKTYRSLRDKSTTFVQKMVESSGGVKDDKENSESSENVNGNAGQKVKRKHSSAQARDAIPPLTISESRRNLGSVTCYLEPKLFTRNPRNGQYTTEELWLPIKDITTTVVKRANNNLANAPKGVVELILELKDITASMEDATNAEAAQANTKEVSNKSKDLIKTQENTSRAISPTTTNGGSNKNLQWNRVSTEVKRKIGINNNNKPQNNLTLRVTTARMRCNNKVKDELEATAGSVYVKTTVFEHGIYVDSWKCSTFYPSLSTKWDVGGDSATIIVPLQKMEHLENMHIRTTVATKTKMGKKLVLGTVLVGAAVVNGSEHMQLLTQAQVNEKIAMWHCFH
ncbi:uncharacterized protein LOC119690271 isoform X2 [Teleopsis dalmanni]|uniref:uncharacterized protein LOC119690271 isoform X2 n=1 Tax=Teleopsis dalmanni TaxID=139649 RepID=UPI0018CF0504|nr:uncharacterized protein LOC119690271 isoform X2 [Teleopsis dalmanni]